MNTFNYNIDLPKANFTGSYLKPRVNTRNISTQHIAALLDHVVERLDIVKELPNAHNVSTQHCQAQHVGHIWPRGCRSPIFSDFKSDLSRVARFATAGQGERRHWVPVLMANSKSNLSAFSGAKVLHESGQTSTASCNIP